MEACKFANPDDDEWFGYFWSTCLHFIAMTPVHKAAYRVYAVWNFEVSNKQIVTMDFSANSTNLEKV